MKSFLSFRSHATDGVSDKIGALHFGGKFFIIGQPSSAKAEFTDRLRRSGVPLRLLPRIPVDSSVGELPVQSRILIDVEALGGIDTIIDNLLSLRHLRPDLVVVLLSKDFARDSFDETRLAVADACVKFPTTIKTLSQAFTEARRNNDAWNARQFALAS